MREFDLFGFAKFIENELGHSVEKAREEALEFGARLIEAEAKRAIGQYLYDWPQLAPATQADREHQGFPANEPLLRTGALRDSIGYTIIEKGVEAEIGSNDPIAVFQELGTTTIPARPFLSTAAAYWEKPIVAMTREMVGAAVAGESIEGEILHIAHKAFAGLASDAGAEYAQVIELDAAEITPMVATPGDPGNGKYVRELNTPVPIEIAYGGTCTAGKNEDMDMYAAVLADALRQGKRVSESVKFYIQFGSQETRDYCVRKGYLGVFHSSGVIVIEPSCGACINAGPGATSSPTQVVISAQNRNFPGRSGPGQMYLASPYTVAASAVAGYIVEYQPSEQLVSA